MPVYAYSKIPGFFTDEGETEVGDSVGSDFRLPTPVEPKPAPMDKNQRSFTTPVFACGDSDYDIDYHWDWDWGDWGDSSYDVHISGTTVTMSGYVGDVVDWDPWDSWDRSSYDVHISGTTVTMGGRVGGGGGGG
jgi:hypothetical protein